MLQNKYKKQLLALFKPYIKKIVLIILFLLISSLVYLITPLINRNIMDNGFLKSDYKVVVLGAVSILVLISFNKVLELLKEIIRVNLKGEITFTLFKDAFNHFEKMKMSEINKKSNTEFLNNLYNDIGNISLLIDNVFFIMITQLFNIFGGLIGLFIISPKLTLFVIAVIPIKLIVVNKFAKTRKKMVEEYMSKNSQFANWFGDTLNGIKDIKLYDIFKEKVKEFEIQKKNIIKIEKKMSIQQEMNMSFDQILLQILIATIYIVGINMILNLELTVGSILSFSAYSSYVVTPISSILNIKLILSSIGPASNRYFEFLGTEVEVEDTKYKETSKFKDINENLNINFENINFSYNGSDNILKNINFSINAKEKVAIIGPNGCGKTTIINLLMRFYTPQDGKIKINNIDINSININDYRKNISLVSQNSYLFNDTIENNIFLYRKFNKNNLQKVLIDCNLYDLYKSLPIDYKLGENGRNLSSGQRQKVLLARALIGNNDLILLDEATSNIDIETENQITQLITTKFNNKTVIIISHKTKILNYVDKIILLNDGCIEAVGNHNELLAKNILYNDILNTEHTVPNC